MKHVTVIVDMEGATRVEVEGVKGPGCTALTRDLESALGATLNVRRTEEHHQQPTEARHGRAANHRPG